eukprot:403365213
MKMMMKNAQFNINPHHSNLQYQQQVGATSQSNSSNQHPQPVDSHYNEQFSGADRSHGSEDDLDFEDTDECVKIPPANKQKNENPHSINQKENRPSHFEGGVASGAVQRSITPGQNGGNIPRSSASLKSNQTLMTQENQMASPKFANLGQYNSKSTVKLNIQPGTQIQDYKQPNDYDGQNDPEQFSQTFQNQSQSNFQYQSQAQSLAIPNQHQQQHFSQSIQQNHQLQYQQQQQQQNQQVPLSTKSMVSSKSHKNFHSVVGNHAFNKLTTNTTNQRGSNHLTASVLNPHQQQQTYSSNQLDTLSNGRSQQPVDPEQDKDFGRAYLKLVKKMYQESGQNLLITQDEVEKLAYQQQCLSLTDFNHRNQQCLENKTQKTKLLQEMKSQQEMQECTFKPQTYSHKQKRNFDQFLQDQQQYEELKKKKNRDRLEQNINVQQQELKHQPIVNKKSAKIVEQKKRNIQEEIQQEVMQDREIEDKPVYERLHKIHYEKLQRQAQKAIEQTNLLTGKTKDGRDQKSVNSRNMKKTKSEANFTSARDREIQSGKTVDELLYEDAKRRWEKHDQKKKNLEKLKDEQIQSTKPPVGTNNSKFAAQKFEKEFYFLVHHIISEVSGNQDQEEPNQDFNLREYDNKKINYVKVGQLMSELGYISANIAPDSVERELLFDMWNMLQGEENSGIMIANIKKFLLAIQGICIDQVEGRMGQTFDNNYGSHNKTNQEDRTSTLLQNNFDQNGILRLNQQECSKLFVKFKPLYINRIQFQGQFKRVKQQENHCTFKPQISQTSEHLAIQRRMRILSETRQTEDQDLHSNQNHNNQMDTMSNQNQNVTQDPAKMDIVKLLLHPVNTDKQWQQNAKFMLDQKELEECTFKPKITNYESNKSRVLQGNDKFLELYSKAKPMHEKRDKTRNDYEFEKGQEECTFQPNIGESQKNMDQLYFSTNQYTDSQFLGSDGGLNQTTTQNIKGYQMMMARMQKGREDRDKVKAMTSRGIPGTIIDEQQLKPLQIEGNTNYKGAFSTFSHHPDFNIHHAHQLQDGGQSQMSKSRLQNSKSNESLQSILNQSKRQTNTQQNTKNTVAKGMNNNQNHEKENIYVYPQQQQQMNSYQDKKPLNNYKVQNQDNLYPNRANSSLSQQSQNRYNNNQQLSNGRSSRFSDTYNPTNDFSYEQEQNKHLQNANNLTTGTGFLNIPSDTDPDHSIASKTTSVKQPLLYVDVNLGPGKSERIVVYEGDTADALAEKFALSHGLDMSMKGKLSQLLDSQIAGLLEKIEEEQNSIHSDNI